MISNLSSTDDWDLASGKTQVGGNSKGMSSLKDIDGDVILITGVVTVILLWGRTRVTGCTTSTPLINCSLSSILLWKHRKKRDMHRLNIKKAHAQWE